MAILVSQIAAVANCSFLHFGGSCNHRGEMVYHLVRFPAYIGTCQLRRNPKKKGKTMAPKALTNVIWDFPVRIFNMVREKIEKMIADRAQADERWLNG